MKINEANLQIIIKWWSDLQNDFGSRATLKRCKNATSVIFEQSYHDLYRRIAKTDSVNTEEANRLAIICGIISHVTENDVSRKIADQMSSSNNKRVLSDLRFRRLLEYERNELYIPMIRIVHMLNKKINLNDLIYDIFYWGDEIRKRWCFDYYSNLS